MQPASDPTTTSPVIDLDTVCRVIALARRYHAKDARSDESRDSVDDGMMSTLEQGTDATSSEFSAFVDGLSDEEQIDLVALAWLGREKGSAREWPERRLEAAAAHSVQTGNYLLELPLLPDALVDGLAAFDLVCEVQEPGQL